MKLIARCPHCGSIWVCWNWFNAFGGDHKEYLKNNPYTKPEDVKTWGHECHMCDHVFMTRNKVKNGIPYKILMLYGRIIYKIWKNIFLRRIIDEC